MATSEMVEENEINGFSDTAGAESALSNENVSGFNHLYEVENALADEEVRQLNYPALGTQTTAIFQQSPTPGQWNAEWNAFQLSQYGRVPQEYFQPLQPFAPVMNQCSMPQGYGYQYGNASYITPSQNGSSYYGNPSSAFAPPQQSATYYSNASSSEYQDCVSYYPALSSGPEYSSYSPLPNMIFPTPPATMSDVSESTLASNSGSSSPISAEPPLLSPPRFNAPSTEFKSNLNAEAQEFVPRLNVPQYQSAATCGLYHVAPSLPADTELMPAQESYQQGTASTSTGLGCNTTPVLNDNVFPPLGSRDYQNLPGSEDGPRRPHSNKTQETDAEVTCAFCYRKGDRNYNHLLKDANGLVLCPYLQAIKCFLCGATGPFAHMSRYCPKNPSRKGKPKGATGTTSSSRRGNPPGDS